MDWQSGLSLEHSHPEDHAGYRDVPAFAPIVSDAFETFSNLPDRIQIPAGATLVAQGAVCNVISLLLHGLVKLVRVNPDGRQATLGLRSSGWYAGAAGVLVKAPSVYAVHTLTPCTVIQISAASFPLTLMQNVKLMRHFLATLSSEVTSMAAAQAEVMSSSAEERLTTFMRERGSRESPMKVLDTLPLLKQAELAQLLSITPEHLSRLLHKSAGSSVDKTRSLHRKQFRARPRSAE